MMRGFKMIYINLKKRNIRINDTRLEKKKQKKKK
jgi:hypothetical protein